jgi:hypothetical protein
MSSPIDAIAVEREAEPVRIEVMSVRTPLGVAPKHVPDFVFIGRAVG